MRTDVPTSAAHHNGPLEDHKPNDMPAARTLVVLVVVLLAVFSVIAAVIYYNAHEEAPDPAPIEQATPIR